jgi:hypothetical protein
MPDVLALEARGRADPHHREDSAGGGMSADAKLECVRHENEILARYLDLRDQIDAIRRAWERGEISGMESIRLSWPLVVEQIELAYGPWAAPSGETLH